MTVSENIEVGLMARKKGDATRERVLTMFPRLRERLHQRAETLSGGEQQMLTTARALCLEPSILLLDEPTEGLQPSMIQLIRETVETLRAEGKAIILVEQRIDAVLSLADRVTFIENGHSRETVPVEELRADRSLLEKYVGV
jgi:branched-chain amino acid transport system ATP-binding protein